jgi:hypothetical protein
VFRDQLKVVVDWDIDGINHRSVNDLTDSFPKALRLALHERDADKRHCKSPFDVDVRWNVGLMRRYVRRLHANAAAL